MHVTKKQTLWAHIGLFYATIAWGSTFFLLRDAVENMSPLILTSYRFLIAAFFLALYLLIKKQKLWANFRFGLGLSILVFLVYVPQAIGLQFTSATNSGFITGLFVAFVPFLTWATFKKIPEINKFIAVFVAIIGLWFLTGGFDQINFGDLITLITAITYALHVLFTGMLVRKINPVVLAFQQFFITGIGCLVIASFIGADLAIPTNRSLSVILYLALIPTLSALVIQAIAQKYVSEIKTALIFCFEPVFAALFAWTLGGELFTFNKAVGGLLIFLAMVVSEVDFRNTKKKARVGEVLH